MARRYGKYRPSKTAAKEFATQMDAIDKFCAEHGIQQSQSSDSYYFTIGEKSYRVSNHSIEASNRGAYDFLGCQIREKYHDDKRLEDVTYIHASKTRIIDIYNDLVSGYVLDGNGKRKNC